MPLKLVVVNALALVMLSRALPADEVRFVPEIKNTERAGNYTFNRDPLQPSPLLKLPIGNIKPRGWVLHQLELARDGMVGQLPQLSEWCRFEGNAWAEPEGKGHSGWEELPYWLKGYGDLGYVLGDEKIIKQARRWIDAVLASQEPDGWFGPDGLKTSLQGKPDLWPHMVMLNVLQSYYEFSGDQRVIDCMTKYFKWQNSLPPDKLNGGYWPRMRAGDNLESIYWLYNRTGEASLLELSKKIHQHMSAEWSRDVINMHNVNIAQGFREPAVYWVHSGVGSDLAAAERNYQKVMKQFGQFPGGGFAGDENCRPGYGDPRQGFETCGITEFMHSFEMLTKITGNPVWAERCEEIAFNSFPASMTPEQTGLHYLTCANQVQLDKENKSPGIENSGTMFSYSPYKVYRCCQHNVSHGWPYYAEELWLATADGGLCASLYSACEVKAKVADGVDVAVVEETDYPFSDTISLTVLPSKPVAFPLYLRMPRWAGKPTLKINDKQADVAVTAPGYIVVDRQWKAGDRATLQLPMSVRLRKWKDNKNSISVDYGPLTFSLKIGEEWKRYGGSEAFGESEVRPTTPWNYGLVINHHDPVQSFEITRKESKVPDQPFTPETAPIEMRAKAKRLPEWKQDKLGLVGLLPQSPVATSEPTEDITLIPMGARG